MSQAFSLYGELSVRQNLVLHAQLFHVPTKHIAARVTEMAERFSLGSGMAQLPERLSLGFTSVWLQFLAIIAIGALFFAGALLRFRKTLAQVF